MVLLGALAAQEDLTKHCGITLLFAALTQQHYRNSSKACQQQDISSEKQGINSAGLVSGPDNGTPCRLTYVTGRGRRADPCCPCQHLVD